jgi:hypothetical protein
MEEAHPLDDSKVIPLFHLLHPEGKPGWASSMNGHTQIASQIPSFPCRSSSVSYFSGQIGG